MSDIGNGWFSKHGDVPNNLVNDIWLDRVISGFGMSDILGRAEHPMCQAIEKLPLTEHPGYRFYTKTGLLHQKIIKIGHLRYLLVKLHGLLHLREQPIEERAHRSLVQFPHLLIAVPPCLMLDGSIVNGGYRIFHAVAV